MKIKIKHLAHAVDLLGLEYARSSNSQTVRPDRVLTYYAQFYSQTKDEYDHLLITFVYPNRVNSIDLLFNKTSFSDDLAIAKPISNENQVYLDHYLPDGHNLISFISNLNGK